MHCSLFAAAIFVALLQLVSAVDISFYESQTECTGSRFICRDIASRVCCTLRDLEAPDFGFAFEIEGIPQPFGGVGAAYRDLDCGAALAVTIGPDECFVRSTRAESGNWIDSGPSGETSNGTASNSTTANAFGYIQNNVERVIRLERGQAKAVVAAYHAKDFDALSKYPEY